MAGIKYLTDIYKKQGKEFLDNLFKKTVVVTEMLNGSSFSFEKNLNDGEISYYKRDQINPISKIDRTIMTYYEFPINYISNLNDKIKNSIPKGWRFGLEYFISNNPISISYDRTPKNNLVLTYIVVKNEFGEQIRTIIDKSELDYWADFIGVERPPIIFQGKLNNEQKTKIQEYISVPFDVLTAQYGTKSFAKYLLSVLNPGLKNTTLNDDLDKPIEGIAFKFGPLDGQGDSISAKLIDPVFEEITKSNVDRQAGFFPNDIYGITILDVMNYILEKGLESFGYSGNDLEDRYISFICNVFESFLDENGEKYRGVDFEEPEFLKGKGFETNIRNVKSERSKKFIEEEKSFESLFKLILSAFRKLKKKPGGFFTEGSIQQFNILVREISEYLSKETIVMESGIPTFVQFRKETKNILIEESEDSGDDVIETDSTPEENQVEDGLTKNLPLESPIDSNPSDELLNKMKEIIRVDHVGNSQSSELRKVNLVIGDFQPFSNGDLKMIQKANTQNQLPVVLAVTKPTPDRNRFFINLDMQRKLMSSIQTEFQDLIIDIVYIDDSLLSSAIKELDNKYDVESLTTQKDSYENYFLQKKNLVRNGIISDSFEIYATPLWRNPQEMREYIKLEDFVNFKKNAPKSIVYLWQELINLHS